MKERAERTARASAVEHTGGEAPRLLAVRTAVPPHVLEQRDVERRVHAQFSSHALVQRLLPVFANTGIERRHSCVPVEWYYDAHGWRERNQRYLESASALLEECAAHALDAAGLHPRDIGTLMTVSTSGIATPSLEARLMERMPFSRTVRRIPLFGLGCAGGALGLGYAADAARADPERAVLLLDVELCTLWFRRDEITKSNIVATALFADGAAAAVLACNGEGPRIIAHGSYTFPASLDVMGWEVADDGLQALFSQDIPHLVRTRMREICSEFLSEHGLERTRIDTYLCHPGGAKVLDALEEVFGLAPGALEDSRAVLREYGNMSSATVLFVLESAVRRGAFAPNTGPCALLTALGPGFTAGFAVLDFDA